MTYEEWKKGVAEATDEVIEAVKKPVLAFAKTDQVEGINDDEALGFITGEQKRAEREIDKFTKGI